MMNVKRFIPPEIKCDHLLERAISGIYKSSSSFRDDALAEFSFQHCIDAVILKSCKYGETFI